MPNVSNALPLPGSDWTPLAIKAKPSSFRAKSALLARDMLRYGAASKTRGRQRVVGGYLRDLAFAQPTQPQMFGYKRAAAAVLALETPLRSEDRGRHVDDRGR